MQQRTRQSRNPSHEAELRRSLNASANGETAVRAFCFELPAGADGAPEWIPYLPAPTADGKLVGEDGRAWTIEDARALAAQIKRKLPIDINHANDIAAPAGKPSPAVGWITAFDVRSDGSTWAKAEWNQRGLNAITGKEYGFISAAFDHTKNNVIKRYAGASLVNHPNFTMPALNSAERNQEEVSMSKAILAALGLPETATEQQAIEKIAANSTELQRATNAAQNPDVTRFVPRADHDAVVARATNAEKRITELEGAQLQKDIDAAISDALKAGKITPATEKYHRANCAKEGGLTAFREYVAAATPVIDNEETRRAAQTGDGKDPHELATRALNFQKQQADLGRAVSIADAMTHVTAADKQ